MAVAGVIDGTPGSGGRAASVDGAVLPLGMGGYLGIEEWFWILKGNLFGFCSQGFRARRQRLQIEGGARYRRRCLRNLRRGAAWRM